VTAPDADSLQPLVIVPCGARKLAEPASAGRPDTGSYHRPCRRPAAALTTPERMLILSSLHGLLPLARVIAPYELRMGQPGSIDAGALLRHAVELDMVDEQPTPSPRRPRSQRAVLAQIARAGVLPGR
jgi:uncharacterized protein DUF6884